MNERCNCLVSSFSCLSFLYRKERPTFRICESIRYKTRDGHADAVRRRTSFRSLSRRSVSFSSLLLGTNTVTLGSPSCAVLSTVEVRRLPFFLEPPAVDRRAFALWPSRGLNIVSLTKVRKQRILKASMRTSWPLGKRKNGHVNLLWSYPGTLINLGL